MFVSRRNTMLCCWALAVCLATSSNAICVASAVSWRLAPVFGVQAEGVTRPTAIQVRGGDANSDAEATLQQNIQEAGKTGKFHVQGWRWHTMSVKREGERLRKLAEQMSMDQQGADLSRLKKAADYVIEFNLKALHRTEAMLFPKMRQWMSASETAKPEVVKAFDKVVSAIEEDKKKLASLGESMINSVGGSGPNVARTLASQSEELVDLVKSMLDREVNLLMPTVGLCVPEKEQKKFNNQVIKFLGVLNARVHLVHMHEVVAESNSKLEKQLWEESIPSLPRSMIPRWKKSLYEPISEPLSLP